MEVEVVIEIPQGSRNRYEVDHETGRLVAHRRRIAMDTPAVIDVRCSAIVFRSNAMLLVHRGGIAD